MARRNAKNARVELSEGECKVENDGRHVMEYGKPKVIFSVCYSAGIKKKVKR